MKIITFSGVDGSGKSTQVTLLRKHLESQGEKVYYFHAIEFSLANRLRHSGGHKNFTPGQDKAVVRASFWKIVLRKFFLRIDILRFKKLLTRLQTEGYTTFVSDRYFYDSIINIAYLEKRATLPTSYTVNIPKPDFAFFLSLTAEDIITRDRVLEQGVAYLEKKLALFASATTSLQLITINARKSADEIFKDILTYLK